MVMWKLLGIMIFPPCNIIYTVYTYTITGTFCISNYVAGLKMCGILVANFNSTQ